MSRVEVFKDSNLRSLLKELRTDIAMAVDDSFPLVYGLADKSIITDQLLKVGKSLCVAQVHTVHIIGEHLLICYLYMMLKCLLRLQLVFTGLCCFNRTLWRRRAEKGSTRQCTRSCPGSWSRGDPPSMPSGATCPKNTTWTATPSCRRCSLTCTPVCHV